MWILIQNVNIIFEIIKVWLHIFINVSENLAPSIYLNQFLPAASRTHRTNFNEFLIKTLKTEKENQQNQFKFAYKMPAILSRPRCVNSLWSRDPIECCYKTRWVLVQVIACCLKAPSHYLNQNWIIIREGLRHIPESNLTGNSQHSFTCYWFENCHLRLQMHFPFANQLRKKMRLKCCLPWVALCVQCRNILTHLALKSKYYCRCDDVIKWKHFPRNWPFVRGIHRSPVNSPHKGQWRGALMFCLICVWINGWVNNREAGDLRRYRAHYDVIVLMSAWLCNAQPKGLPLYININRRSSDTLFNRKENYCRLSFWQPSIP